ncbi:MAG: glycosyltransferase family 4 protein [Desulfomonilia bacterium]
MSRILILIQGSEVPGSRYRILQYVPFLESRGMECTVMKFPGSIAEYGRLLSILPDYETVFVQKKRIHGPFLKLFQKRARRIVYDFDDAVMYNDSFSASPYSRTRQKRFADMVRRSDHVIAGNSFLMEQALAYHDRVSLIPTSLDIKGIQVRNCEPDPAKVTIGWIGSRATIRYLGALRDMLEDVGRRYPSKVELKIICDTFFDCVHIPVNKVAWSKDTEYDEIRGIDIGIMPLLDDPWSMGKCGFKLLQYFAAGVPAVCSPVGVNRDLVQPGVTGFWAKTAQEWVDQLSRLIDEPGLRREMGLAGRALLERGYTVEVNGPRLYSILKG